MGGKRGSCCSSRTRPRAAISRIIPRVEDLLEHHGHEVRTALERGEGVKLSGFGNFQLRDKPQRPGRNPKTGEEIPITARRVVTFHASQKLKALVDKHYPADGQQQSQS